MAPDRSTVSIEHAYRVLDVQKDAPPRTIDASYRKLIKRWHPDRYRPGSDAYTESTLMTKLLNESYARIKNAPLRNAVSDSLSSETLSLSEHDPWAESETSGSSRSEYEPPDPNQEAAEYYKMLERARLAGARDDANRPFDWFGFSVRFIFGALFGAVLSFKVALYWYYESPRFIYTGIVATILFCALVSGCFLALDPPRRSVVVGSLGLAS